MNALPVEIFLALGTNLGDRPANLAQARLELSSQVSVQKCSGIYETPPWGFTDQPAFYNQIFFGTTCLSPTDLLKFAKEIEINMGRVATFRNGPRLIDIDILLYGDLQFNTPELIIPHPRMPERGFVLVPLAEIAPEQIIPGTGQTVWQRLQQVDQSGIHLLGTQD